MDRPRIRPMTDDDVEPVDEVAVSAFADLNARMGELPYVGAPRALAAVRLRHLLATDPGGAWVAERDDRIVGAALALVREGVWGLSLFVVLPGEQSAGTGGELLRRAWAHGDATGRLILASRDPRALRAYVRLGLDLHPALDASGVPRGVSAPDGVRPWRAEDAAWADPLARRVRGAAYGSDLDALLAAGATLSVLEGRGFAAARGHDLRLLVADDEADARTLLAAHLAAADGDTVTVSWITGAQQWAIRACVDAGLDFAAHGALLSGGRLGPLRPYLPCGPYL